QMQDVGIPFVQATHGAVLERPKNVERANLSRARQLVGYDPLPRRLARSLEGDPPAGDDDQITFVDEHAAPKAGGLKTVIAPPFDCLDLPAPHELCLVVGGLLSPGERSRGERREQGGKRDQHGPHRVASFSWIPCSRVCLAHRLAAFSSTNETS